MIDPPTVLIVDDERVNRAALADLLHNECQILLAKDGATALALAASEPDIALILLDVAMPGMDGYEVLHRLRRDPATSAVPVIFVTGHTDEADEERGLLLGAADYIPKPIRPAIVLARVRSHLKLATQRRALERLSQQDPLTGISNRRHFDAALEQAWRRAERVDEVLAVAMVDVDYFKQYNDHYGHGAGDGVLRRVADTLAAVARRPFDLVARYGGEEFVLLLPGVADLGPLLERARADVAAMAIAHRASNAGPVVTVSVGGAVVSPARAPSGSGAADLLAQADAAMYQAKRAGRNRITVADRADAEG